MRYQPDLVTATEIAAWAYCPESWRLQHGLGLPAGNNAARCAGVRHHVRKAFAEWLAAGAIILGRMLVLAALTLLLLWLVWR